MSSQVPQIEVGRPDGLVDVHLLGVPLAIHQQATEHADDLQREFALLRVQQADEETADVPARLLQLMDSLEQQFSGFTDATQEELETAIDEGRESIDLVFRVPPAAKEAALQLDALLDEAEAFCRSGASLLTLATPPDALNYRKWYLGEFVRQAEGGPATPWPGS